MGGHGFAGHHGGGYHGPGYNTGGRGGYRPPPPPPGYYGGGPGFGTGLLEGALIGSMVAGAGRSRGSDVTVVTTGGVAAPAGTYYAGGPSGTSVANNTRIVYSDGRPVAPKKRGCCPPFWYYWVVGPFLISVYLLIAGVCYPHAQNYSTALSLYETRPVYYPSVVWYENVQTTTPNIKNGGYDMPVTVLKFDSEPPLTETTSWSYSATISFGGYGNEFYDWSWFLMDGSTITFSWNYNYNTITVYIIKGDENYQGFVNDDGYDYELQQNGGSGSFTYDVYDADVYYLITLQSSYQVTGTASYTIVSKLYDVSNPVASCIAPCTMPLDMNLGEFVIMTTPSNGTEATADTEFDFNVYLNSRVWFILVILFLIPIFILSIIGILIGCAGRKKARAAMAYAKIGETTPILQSEPAIPPLGTPYPTTVAPVNVEPTYSQTNYVTPAPPPPAVSGKEGYEPPSANYYSGADAYNPSGAYQQTQPYQPPQQQQYQPTPYPPPPAATNPAPAPAAPGAEPYLQYYGINN